LTVLHGRQCFFFQAEDGRRDRNVTGVQTCALPILMRRAFCAWAAWSEISRMLWVMASSCTGICLLSRGLCPAEYPHYNTAHGKKIGRASCREREEVRRGAASTEKKARGGDGARAEE